MGTAPSFCTPLLRYSDSSVTTASFICSTVLLKSCLSSSPKKQFRNHAKMKTFRSGPTWIPRGRGRTGIHAEERPKCFPSPTPRNSLSLFYSCQKLWTCLSSSFKYLNQMDFIAHSYSILELHNKKNLTNILWFRHYKERKVTCANLRD